MINLRSFEFFYDENSESKIATELFENFKFCFTEIYHDLFSQVTKHEK